MKREGPLYSLGFALLVCVVCALALAFVSESLRPRRELNEAADKKRHILKVLGVSGMSPQEIDRTYQTTIRLLVIDFSGNVLPAQDPEDVSLGEGVLPLYVYQAGNDAAYAFPISGKGLWSSLYGFLALEADAVTIRGITFYQHGETPGLGGQIDSPSFESGFRGKKIWDAKKDAWTGLTLVKGKVADQIPPEKKDFYVDGITGATVTSKGVSALLDKGLKSYEPFFAKIRKK